MMQTTEAVHPLAWIGFALLGASIGVGHLSALVWNTRVFLQAGKPALALALPLLRITLTGGGFMLAVHYGDRELLACLAGFLTARTAVINIVWTPS